MKDEPRCNTVEFNVQTLGVQSPRDKLKHTVI